MTDTSPIRRKPKPRTECAHLNAPAFADIDALQIACANFAREKGWIMSADVRAARALAGKPYCGRHHAVTTGVGTASERRATKLSGPGLRRGDRRVLNVTKRIGR